MGKYIIDIDEKNICSDDNGSQIAISVKVNDASAIFYTEIPLTPYTEPDMEQVRKEAYKEGREVGIKDGMCEAWEAARKIGSNSMCSLEEMGFDFSQCAVDDYNPSWFVVKNYSASEAIEKIRQYEQKQEEIKVGDEVEAMAGNAVVIEVIDGGQTVRYMYPDTITGRNKACNVTRTGRHFPQIAEVLQKMKES